MMATCAFASNVLEGSVALYESRCPPLQAVTLRRLKSSTFEGRPIIQLPQRIVNVNLAPFATRLRERGEADPGNRTPHAQCSDSTAHGKSETSVHIVTQRRV